MGKLLNQANVAASDIGALAEGARLSAANDFRQMDRAGRVTEFPEIPVIRIRVRTPC